MKSLGEILQLATQHFEKAGVKRPRLSAEELLADALKVRRIDLYMQFDRPLVEGELETFRQHIKRRVKHEPVPYILGEVDFYHCQIEVSSAVLIPRQETEILLDQICSSLRSTMQALSVWEVCTGSGALAVGLKKQLPHLQVYASDISSDALEVAKKNACRNGVEIIFYQGDLLEPFKGKKADCVICNPPYISEGEYEVLEADVRSFEPKRALVGGDTGLEFYERLAKELPVHLNAGAKVFLEIGAAQGESVNALFQEPFWKVRRLQKDWAGHNRFFFLEFE